MKMENIFGRKGIVNQYEGNNAAQIWDAYTIEQKQHFISDHLPGFNVDNQTFEELPENVRFKFIAHVIHGQYEHGGTISPMVYEVLDAYVQAALWSSIDHEGNPLDAKYRYVDIDFDTLNKMQENIEKFLQENMDVIQAENISNSQLGHSLWLTQNHHGAGFFDLSYEYDDSEKRLMDSAHNLGTMELYVGDDGLIYGHGVAHKSTEQQNQNIQDDRIDLISKATTIKEAFDAFKKHVDENTDIKQIDKALNSIKKKYNKNLGLIKRHLKNLVKESSKLDETEFEKGGKITRNENDYEQYLNESYNPDYESEEWIIGGRNRAMTYFGKYGSAIRRHDPIGFIVGYREWLRNQNEYKCGGIIKTKNKSKYSEGGLVGFVGTDADIETSLMEYGVIAKQSKYNDYPDEYFVVYKIDENHFGTGYKREKDINDLIMGREWANEKDILSFLDYVGTSG